MSRFIRRSARTVYQNPWLAFEAHDIVHPNGVPGEHGLVRCSRAAAVVVIDGEHVWLTEQERFAADATILEIVKGGAHEDETLLHCAQRELREELGLEAHSWTPLGRAYECPSISYPAVTLYLAHLSGQHEQRLEAVESIRPVRMPFPEALRLALEGGIDDGISVAGIVRAAKHLGRLTG